MAKRLETIKSDDMPHQVSATESAAYRGPAKPGDLPNRLSQMTKALYWFPLAALCLIVGLYPLVYLMADEPFGLLQMKSDSVVSNRWWQLGFYTHIISGGVALTVGWSQFVNPWRQRSPKLHRTVGKLYVLMVGTSSIAAVCIAPWTSTGWTAALGFGCLGAVWLCVTLQAWNRIRQQDLRGHKCMMVYSYSACCAAVTLRLWLPLLIGVLRLDFAVAYPVVSWLCWVPNLLIASAINSRSLKMAPDPSPVRS